MNDVVFLYPTCFRFPERYQLVCVCVCVCVAVSGHVWNSWKPMYPALREPEDWHGTSRLMCAPMPGDAARLRTQGEGGSGARRVRSFDSSCTSKKTTLTFCLPSIPHEFDLQTLSNFPLVAFEIVPCTGGEGSSSELLYLRRVRRNC